MTLKTDSIPSIVKLYELHLKIGELEQALARVKACLHLDPEQKQCAKAFKLMKKLTKAVQKVEDLSKVGKLRDAIDVLDTE